jgi:two-component system CheB/CheR fusion protein
MDIKANAKPHVVGIGASAGGLEALSQFVAGLAADLGCIYVVAQHMSPTHRSLMADILSRETRLPVQELTDGDTPMPDVIYIIPPGNHLVFKAGRFLLSTPSPEIAPKPSINILFQSMAEEFEERAVGIILSGTGSDGTRGLRAIKSAGGITFVQIPETAKYDGMPRSAIDACVADRIVAPDQIGRELERLVRFPETLPDINSGEQRPAELSDLFERVRQRTKIDFSSYKLATVQRRLQRRMVATDTGTLADYLGYTDGHPGELDALAKETLISVTEFFRDKDAFRALERFARDIVGRKLPGEEIRVWVVGCATGEEAYSLAILFSELIAEKGTPCRLQVFATDIDNNALSVARRGIYNQTAMAEMPAEYVTKYFKTSGNGFEPTKNLRECVTFARQDISVDPPFMRLDLVTCRNVMIYFNTDLQAKVLSILHYSLRNDGLLFLGRSETVSQQEALFSSVDRRARLFRPRGQSRPINLGKLVRGQLKPSKPESKNADRSNERLFLHALADHFGPAMLIDAGCRILHSHGPVSSFINFPSGVPQMNLAQMIVPELANETLTTLHRARRNRASAFSRKRRIASLDGQVWRLAIHPVGTQSSNDLYLAVLERPGPLDVQPTAADAVAAQEQSEGDSDDELASTREHLQVLMEEMAASNEEMQALNEEVQASNEELQATNEELEASNEEMQATNEELVSVNEESLIKSAELAVINSDFESVYNTIDFPIMVFDPDLLMKRANGAAIRLFDLPPSSAGIHISRLKLPAFLGDIDRHLASALIEQRKENFQILFDKRTFQVFVTPATNPTGSPQSVVLVVVDHTDLAEAQGQIRESQERLLSIMNHSTSAVALKDAAGCYEFVNHKFEEVFGAEAASAIGKTDQQLFPHDIAHSLRRRDLEVMGQLSAIESIDKLELPRATVWLESVRFPIFDARGAVRAICVQSNDVTMKRQAEEQLRLAAKVFDRAGEAICITDSAGIIITVNDAFCQITGYSAGEVIGNSTRIMQSGRHGKDFYEAMWRSLKELGSWQGEIFNRRKTGEIFPEWLTINSVKEDNGSVLNYVAIFSDITAIKSSQRRIEFLATHDELTGIPNRSLLMDRLKHDVAQANRRNTKLAVLFIDLDNFKVINDSLGHDIGDRLLILATERLRTCVRDTDTLARLGGDEFVAVLTDVELNIINSKAGRIVDFMSDAFNIDNKDLYVSASIGISVFPDDGDDIVTLLKHADTAMYRAKERGRNQYQFFAEEMKVIALQRLMLETGLRLAIASRGLRLCYQPQVDIRTGAIIGAEALLRWHDPNLGDVSPAHFIPIAESCGLIGAIGERVFSIALEQIAVWRNKGLSVPRISINVSAHQMRDAGFVEKVGSWLKAAGIGADAIGIELTESALMERIETVREMLVRFDLMGVKISIDDFGTGYSSLAYLRKLPIHELKIDKSFIDGIACEQDDRSIASAIINMSRALGIQVVAEGVETDEQLNVLAQDGCELVQGYLFHRPLAPEAFARLLESAAIDGNEHLYPPSAMRRPKKLASNV